MLFATAGQLDRARRERRYPRDQLWLRLHIAAGGHLDLEPDELRSLRGSNLFVWDAALTDLSVLDALVDDGRYLDHALSLADSLANGGWQRSHFDGHIHVPWVLGALVRLWDLHRDHLDSSSGERLGRTMTEMAEFVERQLATQKWGRMARLPWNHPTIGYCSLGLAGLALEGHARSADWVDVALECGRRFLDVGLSRSGATWEGISYCGFVFRQLGTFLRGIEAVGRLDEIAPTGSEAHRRLQLVPSWYAHEVLPRGGGLQNFNDSTTDPHEALFGFLSTFADYQPRLCAAVWERLVGASGCGTFGFSYHRSSLADAVLFFPDVPVDVDAFNELRADFTDLDLGYVSTRDEWSSTASVFSFNAGPMRGSRHDQSDNTSFTLVLDGREVVLDSGPFPRRGEGYNSSSWGHNLVFVDGRSQRPAGEGIGVSGEIIAVEHHDDHTALVGDATESYGKDGFNPVRHAHRHAVFVRTPTPYLLTYDDVDKDGCAHRYEHSLHLPTATGCTGQAPTTLTVTDPDGVEIAVVTILSPLDVTTRSRPWTSSPLDAPHGVWMIGIDAVDPHFVVLFGSERVGLQDYSVTMHDDRVCVRLDLETGTDEFEFDRWIEGGRPRAPRLSRRRRSP
jgi:hypothetical protein